MQIDAKVGAVEAPSACSVSFSARGQDATGIGAAKVLDRVVAAMTRPPGAISPESAPLFATTPTYQKPPLSGRMAAALLALVVVVVAAGFGVNAALGHRHAGGCPGALDRLAAEGAGAQVAGYEHDLVTSCPDYQTFLNDYNANSKLIYSPSTALVFCAAGFANETPPDDYNSTLCSEARAVDGAGL